MYVWHDCETDRVSSAALLQIARSPDTNYADRCSLIVETHQHVVCERDNTTLPLMSLFSTTILASLNYPFWYLSRLSMPFGAFLKLTASSRPSPPPSDSPKCLKFSHWLTLCTINIHLLTYLLTYLLNYLTVSSCFDSRVRQLQFNNCCVEKNIWFDWFDVGLCA